MNNIRILFHTDKGDIAATIFANETPLTAANFLHLASGKYYDGLSFHRVIADFMIQGGCPEGNGSGGPGYKFADEFLSFLRHDKPGILSMANAGPNSNGSQFFITHLATPWLDGKHTVFGEVTEGQDVVNAIRAEDKIQTLEILDSTDELFAAQADQIAKWKKVLGW